MTKAHNRLFGFLMLMMLTLSLGACGYKMQGMQRGAHESVLGAGEKTIAITKVEQSSLFAWVPYTLRTELYTEMNMRKLATWVKPQEADYTMEVEVKSFSTRAFVSCDDDETLLNSVSAVVIVDVFDKSNNLVWSSGDVSYSENYENVREEQAIREILREIVYIIYDRMQDTF